jgi:quercetin dioxygenase-like cupin family protein
MRKVLIAVVVVLGILVAAQQSPVEITSEPSHHQVLENSFVRAFAVNVAPGQSSLVHRHGHDYLSVSLGDAQIINAKVGAAPANASFKDGDVRFSAAPVVHAVTNTGTGPFRNITIELLGTTSGQHACTESCAVTVPCDAADKAACPSGTKVMSADQWTVTTVTLPAGARYGQHAHAGSFLLIPLTDGDLKGKGLDGPETAVHWKTGEISWGNGPVTHTVSNVGKTTARAVIVEFTPAGK